MTCYSNKLSTLISLVCLPPLFAGGGAAVAQGLDSHVHGNAELNVVLVGQQIQFEFVSPAMNLLGFERAPGSADETALFERVTADLQASEWLLGAALADCQMSTLALEVPEFGAESHDHDDEGHEHERNAHEHEDEGHSHADFRVQYLFDCPTTPAREYRVRAFSHYGGLEEITVQWLADNRQGLAELTVNDPVFSLE